MPPRYLPSMAGMSTEYFQALPLVEQWRLIAAERVRRGLQPYNYGQAPVVRETADGGTVRESASASDMPNILGNNLYRQLDDWFAQYTGKWPQYCLQIPVEDFRPKLIAFIAELEDAIEIRQERDYQDSAISDLAYTLAIKRWGRQITLPFVVIENDDKNFLAQMPRKMQNAADRTMQKIIVRNTLEANPNAYDGAALFSSGRGNLATGAGSALSAANVQAAIATVQTAVGDAQLNPSGVSLNIPPKFLVVPPALQFTAANILNSVTLIMAGTSGTVTTMGNSNPLRAGGLDYDAPLVPIVERYLTNVTAWYVLPEPEYGPISVAVRNGRGLRPRMWQNVPMRQSVMGSRVDDYLLSVGDIVYGFDFDINATATKPWSSVKYAGA